MNVQELFSRVLDPYELRARLQPGLLVLFPLIAYFVCIMGPKHPLLTTLASVLAAIGGPYALGNFSRTYGQRAQEELFQEWGGSPSVQLLRHRDKNHSSITTQSYHDLAKSKLGISLPSAEEEMSNQTAADAAYGDVVDKLRNLTRDKKKFPLVFNELTHYGFNRNCYGMRFIGVAVSLISLSLVVIRMRPSEWKGFYGFTAAVDTIQANEALAAGIAGLFLLLWLFHFGKRTVRQSAFSYAFRLLESLQAIPRPRPKASSATNAAK